MFKYATSTTSVRWNESIMRLAQDDAWDADDPFVKARPDLFSDSPSRVFTSGGAVQIADDVETATVRPGSRRRVK